MGIATHSRSAFEYLLSQGIVVVIGNPLYGPKIGSINITTMSVPAGDPYALEKANYIAGSRKPSEDVSKMKDTELLEAKSIPVYQVQKVPDALLATPFTQPNKPQFSVIMKDRVYELFV